MIFSNNEVYSLDDILKKIEVIGYKKIEDFQQDVFKIAKTGEEVEYYMPILNCNYIKLDRENEKTKGTYFSDGNLRINLKDINQYILMADSADAHLINPLGGTIIAVYNTYTEFPIARFYTYTVQNETDFNLMYDFFTNKKYPYNKYIHDIEGLVDLKNSENRISEYLENVDKLFGKSEKYAKGRIKNTSVTGGILIARKDYTCPICNNTKNKANELEKITISSNNFDFGMEIIMQVCKNCLSDNAKDNGILKYIFQKMNLEKILKERELTIHEIRDITKYIIKYYLQYEIIDINTKNNYVIKARTKKGFIIKFRLNAIDDYGYNIFSLDNESLVRFDCAPDHPDKVEFMPHHVHNNLQHEDGTKDEIKTNKKLTRKEKKELKKEFDITDSFLSGYMGIDYISIEKKVNTLTSNKKERIEFYTKVKKIFTLL
jgi:hypothetical protein